MSRYNIKFETDKIKLNPNIDADDFDSVVQIAAEYKQQFPYEDVSIIDEYTQNAYMLNYSNQYDVFREGEDISQSIRIFTRCHIKMIGMVTI